MAAIHAAAFADERPWGEGEIAALLARPGTVLAANEAAFLIGQLVVDEAEILTLATDRAWRRRGHARAVLDDFLATCAARGARTVFLDVAADNTAARALYAEAGFAEAGRRRAYYARHGRPAVDAILMSRTLGGPGTA